MNEKQDRLPFGQAMAYTRRAFSIWWEVAPEIFVSATVRQAVDALSPYVPLYFTARLVNAIAGGGDGGTVWRTLWLLLLSTAAAGVVRAGVTCWDNGLQDSRQWPAWNRVFFNKLLSMDFCDVDDPKIQALFTQIQEINTWGNWGLMRVYTRYCWLVEEVFRILGALALSVTLFTMPVPADSPLAWLNHPGCLAAMLALLVLTVLVSPLLYGRAQAYYAKVDGTQANRFFEFFGWAAIGEPHRGTDIRTYGQDIYFQSKHEEEEPTMPYGIRSQYARDCWGAAGALFAASKAVDRTFAGVIYLFVGLKALGGAFGVGSVTQYVGALAGLAKGVSNLLVYIGALRVNAEYLKPVYQFLDTPNNMYQGSLTTEKRSDRNYEIEFKDVSFQYPGTDAWALRHVSMKFNVGERLAVVGENGSGKTTFIKLLCRLYDPTEGKILLNGIDIRKYRYDNYLALFSVVFQDFKLLAQPLGANVAAAEEYDRERAEQCLVKAGFGARLGSLPKGLDTCLYREFEDDGVEISGGEAQKIALARVLYQDAPFIVLDEPTAALDPEAEAEIYTKFNDIVEDKTAIYISHRLSSCRFCDEIAVFDQGRVVQQGTHDGLVEIEGKYQALWEAQAQYYKKED
ncbi:MAG: ABC transporter ATP-binding protein [Clostridiales bacterium]|nr:ABC transporter ATP-binding protein [Clostridiales bacterium]